MSVSNCSYFPSVRHFPLIFFLPLLKNMQRTSKAPAVLVDKEVIIVSIIFSLAL